MLTPQDADLQVHAVLENAGLLDAATFSTRIKPDQAALTRVVISPERQQAVSEALENLPGSLFIIEVDGLTVLWYPSDLALETATAQARATLQDAGVDGWAQDITSHRSTGTNHMVPSGTIVTEVSYPDATLDVAITIQETLFVLAGVIAAVGGPFATTIYRLA